MIKQKDENTVTVDIYKLETTQDVDRLSREDSKKVDESRINKV